MRLTVLSAIVVLSVAANAQAGAQITVEPINDLPNPYRRVEPWAQLPDGMEQWPAVIGVEPGPDGNLYVLHRCYENSCAGRSEAPIVKFDTSGKPLASWGAGMFVYPHGFHVDRDGNVWVTDARGDGGSLHLEAGARRHSRVRLRRDGGDRRKRHPGHRTGRYLR